MAKTDAPRIAILGAGPIGLEAALYARRLNLPVILYERGRIGEHLRRWGHVRLFSPFGMNGTPLGRAALLNDNPRRDFPADGDCLTGREHVTTYLEPLAQSAILRDCLRSGIQVVQLGRRGLLKDDRKREGQPFRLLLRDAKGRETIEEADVVLDCTGTYGQHRWLGDGGIPAAGECTAEPHITYALPEVLGEKKADFAGRSILVVGAGYSAATTVCNLAALAEQNPSTWVMWVARGNKTQPLKRIANDPLKERDRLAARANTLATRGEGNVEFHPQSAVEGVEWLGADKGFKVTARCGGKAKTWEVERVVANVGYTPDAGIYRELQVHECYASLGPMALAAALLKHAGADGLSIPPQGPNVLRNPESNFFILGAKSYGRNSNFLLRAGFEQVRDTFALITGKADLDLYRKR
jgi:thioredoxin reductase